MDEKVSSMQTLNVPNNAQKSKKTHSLLGAIAAHGDNYELQTENQRLRAKVKELEKWIEEIGKPSELLAAKLEDRYIVAVLAVFVQSDSYMNI